jgi:tight adherence protein C
MGIAAISFILVFLLFASGGLLLFYRQAMFQRMSTIVTPRDERRDLLGTIHQTGLSVKGMLEYFERVLPKSQAEQSVVQQRLIRAGFRSDSAVKIFYGVKVLVPISFCIVAVATGFADVNPFMAYVCSLGLGYLAPDFWLGRRIAKRQQRIKLGLPTVRDFLSICIEAGLGMDQATARTAEELRRAQPDLSDELDLVVLEQRAGRPRSDAWKQFAERTDVESVRRLVSVLVQSEQLGTSVAKTLRIHSDILRTQRRQQVEEQAAKTTVKLVFPLVLFIFPSIFLVTLGPEAIIMSEQFQKFFTH